MIQSLSRFCFYFSIVAVLVGCAQVIPPQGGSRDTQPPQVIEMTPKNSTTNFSANSFYIEFDEFVQLNDVYNQLLVSPPLDNLPEISIKRKGVLLQFDEELKPNTTYTFNFGEGVTDFTEGNAAEDLGEKLGRLMADELKEHHWCDDVDAIIPVPLHPKKMKLRGFNQAKCIADGMSEIWDKPVSTGNLIRKIHNPTQTQKSRYARWQNTSNIFDVRKPHAFEGKHLVLVDDVVTTGSTIEACALQLAKIEGVKISVASVAFPMN